MTKKVLIIVIIILCAGLAFLWWDNSSPNQEITGEVDLETESVVAESLEPEEELTLSEPVTLVAVGDIMLSRHVWTKIQNNGGDPRWPFLKTADLLKNADITFANLESPISDLAEPPKEGMSFIAPSRAIDGLKYAGIDIVSLANNHTGNFGNDALLDCQKLLQEQGIAAVGAGKNIEEAHKAVITEVKGNKIAWLAYENIVPDAYAAGVNEPGVAWMNIDRLEKDIASVRDQADYVLVSMHAGTEYVFEPIDSQVNFAHSAIDFGADMVIGHHPHVVQAKEVYNGKQIIYSLGNFVFDQMWSEETRRGEVLKATLDKGEIKDIEFVKVRIYDYNQPRIEEW